MHIRILLLVASGSIFAPQLSLAQDDLFFAFTGTGLDCKKGDPRPGCNKVWKVPPETIAMCRTDAKSQQCEELLTALARGATLKVEVEEK